MDVYDAASARLEALQREKRRRVVERAITDSSGNVFADLGLKDADALETEARREIAALMARRGKR